MDASLRFERSLERIVTEHKFMWCEVYGARKTRLLKSLLFLTEPLVCKEICYG